MVDFVKKLSKGYEKAAEAVRNAYLDGVKDVQQQYLAATKGTRSDTAEEMDQEYFDWWNEQEESRLVEFAGQPAYMDKQMGAEQRSGDPYDRTEAGYESDTRVLKTLNEIAKYLRQLVSQGTLSGYD